MLNALYRMATWLLNWITETNITHALHAAGGLMNRRAIRKALKMENALFWLCIIVDRESREEKSIWVDTLMSTSIQFFLTPGGEINKDNLLNDLSTFTAFSRMYLPYYICDKTGQQVKHTQHAV